MAGESAKRSSRSDKKEPSLYALLPLGKHTGKSAISVTRPVIVVGSRESCRIHLNSTSVSQQHALLVKNNGTYYVHDLASRNHVIVNGKRVLDRDLNNGDELRIGSFILKFTSPVTTPVTTSIGDAKRPVKPSAPAAALFVPNQSRPAALTKRVFIIGRRGGSDILLADASVSTMHAVVFEQDGQRVLRDLGSRTGTWVNGVQVHQHVLNPGDQIKIGPSAFTFQLTDQMPVADAKSAAPPMPGQSFGKGGRSARGGGSRRFWIGFLGRGARGGRRCAGSTKRAGNANRRCRCRQFLDRPTRLACGGARNRSSGY